MPFQILKMRSFFYKAFVIKEIPVDTAKQFVKQS